MKKLLALNIILVLVYACSSNITYDTQSEPIDEQTILPTWQPNAMINLYLNSQPLSFDPVKISDIYSYTIINHITDTLYVYDYYDPTEKLMPSIAKTMPIISNNGLTYTFTIHEGIYYYDPYKIIFGHNEREIIAQDFIYTLLRNADITQSGSLYWMLANKIVGLDKWREESINGGNYEQIPKGITLIDDYTFSITLTQAYPQLLHVLAQNNFSPLPAEYHQFVTNELENLPIGSGPYYLDPNSKIMYNKFILRKNPTYRDVYINSPFAPEQLIGKKLPLNAGINYFIITKNLAAWKLFQEKKIDIFTPRSQQLKHIISEQKLLPTLAETEIQLSINTKPDILYGVYNFEHPVWGPIMQSKKGVLIRRAIQLAYDIQTEINTLYNGQAIIAQIPIPPEFINATVQNNPYVTYNVERAKELLAQAGYPHGEKLPVLTILNTVGNSQNLQYELFHSYMKKIGIKTKNEVVDLPQFIQALEQGDDYFQMAFLAWHADYPDAQNFLQLFYGPYSAPFGNNYARYHNDAFDALYEQAITLFPGKKRDSIYARMIDIITNDNPWFLTVHRTNYTILPNYMHNYIHTAYAHSPVSHYQIIK